MSFLGDMRLTGFFVTRIILVKADDSERLLRGSDTILCSDMHRIVEFLEGLHVNLKSDRF